MKNLNSIGSKQTVWFALLPFFTVVLYSSCIQTKYVASPGRIIPDSLAAHNRKFTSFTKQIDSKPKEKYEVIGHALSSWRYYPMDVNRKGMVYGNGVKGMYNSTPADTIIKLIDRSISYDPCISLEMDVQYIPASAKVDTALNRNSGYIMHNIPKWEKKRINKPGVIGYFKANTLKAALDHIVKKNYYEKCKVYIEIKVTKRSYRKGHEYLNDSQCIKLAKELTAYLQMYKRTNDENWLCIYSFSPMALTKFRNSIPDEIKNKIDYILVAGYVPVYQAFIASFKGYVPRFNKKRIDFLYSTEWIKCVWFSAQGIPDFKKQFYQIDSVRQHNHPDWQPLTYSFATYPNKDMDKYMMKKGRNSNKKINIRSFMFDMDDENKSNK